MPGFPVLAPTCLPGSIHGLPQEERNGTIKMATHGPKRNYGKFGFNLREHPDHRKISRKNP